MVRLAYSLVTLRSQVNKAYPGRPTESDGWIGDPDHSSRVSDHNPNHRDVVCALDLTEWVQNGVEMNDVLAEELRESRDPRIKYVICDGRMFSSYSTETRKAWEWGRYTGINSHSKHVHISVWKTYDDPRPFEIDFKQPTQPTPEDIKMGFLFRDASNNKVYLFAGGDAVHITTSSDHSKLRSVYKDLGDLSAGTVANLLKASEQ